MESRKWKREQHAQEIERIDKAAAEVTRHAGFLMVAAYSEHKLAREAPGELRASFTRWYMLINPHCASGERKRIKEQLELLLTTEHSYPSNVNRIVIEITHAVKIRIIEDAERPWWKFW